MGYNPDDLEQEAEQAEQITAKGEITDIEETTASEAYDGNEVGDDREVLAVTVEPELDGDDDETSDVGSFDMIFSLPKGAASWNNPAFKLGKFKRRYGQLPREGMEIDLTTNENGFYRIDLSEADGE